jgi:LPXTG-site transpeptidase (sortase) family protein
VGEPNPQDQSRPETRRRKRLALAASVVLLVAGALVLGQAILGQGERPPRATTATTAYRPPAPTKNEKREPTRQASDKPRVRLPPGHKPASGPSIARVIIPAIGVKAPLIKLGLNSDDTLQVPSRPQVTGWWTGGARPGGRGAAVIVGHIDSQSGPAVFHNIGKLRPGDRVTVVQKSGRRATYGVSGQMRVPKNNFPADQVYTDTSQRVLRLITCTGEFDDARGHYRDNLIVFGRKV